jgi:hypothetical protein
MAHLKAKHYEAVAKIIREYRHDMNAIRADVAVIAGRQLGYALADYFVKENPKFNRLKFLKQAGITP